MRPEVWLIDSKRIANDLRRLREKRELQSDKELLDTVISMIEREPMTDPKKYAFWFYDKERGVFYCSDCKHEAAWEGRSKFCPDCGAVMLGFEPKEERVSDFDWGIVVGGRRVFLTKEGKIVETF